MTEHVRRAPKQTVQQWCYWNFTHLKCRTIPNCGNKEYIPQLPERAVFKNPGCVIMKKKTYIDYISCHMLLVACAIFVPRLKGDTAGHVNSGHRGETLRAIPWYTSLSISFIRTWKLIRGWVSAFIERKKSARPPNFPPSVTRRFVNLYL